MNEKRNNWMWPASLVLIGTATVLLLGLRAAALELPDPAVRVLGIVELAALAVLAFTTVGKLRRKP